MIMYMMKCPGTLSLSLSFKQISIEIRPIEKVQTFTQVHNCTQIFISCVINLNISNLLQL